MKCSRSCNGLQNDGKTDGHKTKYYINLNKVEHTKRKIKDKGDGNIKGNLTNSKGVRKKEKDDQDLNTEDKTRKSSTGN